jgi:RsiW-degrading membrane proteinase PrsW (M82 family)
MVGIEARRIKAFNLSESIVINLVQFLTRNGLDMIKHTKLKTHVLSLLLAVHAIDAACLMAVKPRPAHGKITLRQIVLAGLGTACKTDPHGDGAI